mgnify:FL=1
MKIIEPKAEVILQDGFDMINHIANIARVCYGKDVDGSNPSSTGGLDKDNILIKSLIASRHYSVFRHWIHYFIVPRSNVDAHKFYLIYEVSPYVRVARDNNNFYINFNHHFAIDHYKYYECLKEYEVSYEHFSNTELGYQLCWLTFKCVTQISTSREFNRVSPNNIVERSTRYCYEEGEIVRPHWMKSEDATFINVTSSLSNEWIHNNKPLYKYVWACIEGFTNYKELVLLGLPKQDARGVLPLDTKTVVVYTYPIDIWKRIINLRYYGTTGKSHENAKILAGIIRNKINELGYEL